MGLYFDKGFEIGIAGGASDVIGEVRNLARDTEKAFTPALSAGAITGAYLSRSGRNGVYGGANVVQNNYFTQRNLTAFETLKEQRKLNKQLVGVFA